MPTYEYECKSCSHCFETFQAMSDQPVKICPQCSGEVRRLIFGGTGVIFKGSGYYVTDKSKSAKPDSKKSDSSPCAACPAGGEAGKCPAAQTDNAGGSKNAAAV